MTEHPAVIGAEVPAPSSGLEDRLSHLWSVHLPLLADPWTRRLGDALADGAWTARWRAVGAFAPPVAFLMGLLFSLLWPGMKEVYTESLIFMTLVIAGAIFSGPIGVMLLTGYVLGDLARAGPAMYGSGMGGYWLRHLGGDLVSYMLLTLPAVILPQLGRRMAEEISTKLSDESKAQLPLRAALYAVAMGLLTFLWCQAMIVLVRPVFTFMRNSPTTEAVEQVQTRWEWLAFVAAVAAMTRIVLEHLARRSAAAAGIRGLEEQRWSRPEQRGVLWRKVPLVVRVALAAIVATLMLAGTYVTVVDAVVVLAVVASVKAWRSGVFGIVPLWWSSAASKIPVLVRFIIGPLLGYMLANLILTVFWRTGSLRPVMLGAVLTYIIFQVLFPHVRPETSRALTTAAQEGTS